MKRFQDYLQTLSQGVKKDVFFIGLTVTLYVLIIIQYTTSTTMLKVIQSLCAIGFPFYLLVLLFKPPVKRKKAITISKKKQISTKLNFGVYSFFIYLFLCLYSITCGNSILLILSFVILIVGNIIEIVKNGKIRRIILLLKNIYLSGFLPYLVSFITVSVTLTLILLLDRHLPEYFQYKWQPFPGVTGSLVTLPLEMAFKAGWILLSVVSFIILLLILPFLAFEEEMLFRYKRLSWGEIVRGALIFGPIHVISGVPLYAGLALSFSGIMFSLFYKYTFLKLKKLYPNNLKRIQLQAIFPTATLHTIHNTVVIGIYFFSYFF